MVNRPIATIGPLDIHLPTGSLPDFWLTHDLAGLFGMELNSEAEEKLNQALEAAPSRPAGRIEVEQDSDHVMVHCTTPEAMVFAVRVIFDLSQEKATPADYDRLIGALREWKKPEPQEWRTGDVFSIPLKDGTFAFGRVLHGSYKGHPPTCALFEHRDPRSDTPVEAVLKSRIIGVLHLTEEDLTDGVWRVLGSKPLGMLSRIFWAARSTPDSSGSLGDLANAWHGLEPWNVKHDERYFDKLLRFGVRRPRAARVLGSEERREFRKTQGWES